MQAKTTTMKNEIEFMSVLPKREDTKPYPIDYSNYVLSMSKSMEDLKAHVTSTKNTVRKQMLQKAKKKISESCKSLEEVKTVLGRKHSVMLKNILTLIAVVEWRFAVNEISPISQKNEALLSRFKSKTMVGKVINACLKIGLLVCVSEYHNSYTHTAKTYVLNYKLLEILRKGEKPRIVFDDDGDDEEEDEDSLSCAVKFDQEKVKIGSNIRMSIGSTSEKKIREILDKRYPMFAFGKEIADRLNKTLPDEQKVKWDWKIKIAKNSHGTRILKRIGFRASSSLCTYKEHENENLWYVGKWRKDYFKEFFGDVKCKHYDVNGSIWRLTYNLNHDKFLDASKDVYEELWKCWNDGKGFKDKEERALFKAISQRLYFGDNNSMGKQFVYSYNKLLDDIGEKEKCGKEDVENSQDCMESFRGWIEDKFLGKIYRSEIFMHESCVHLMMLEKMLKKSKVVQVYDSFYYDGDFTDSEIDVMYSCMISQYKSKFAIS